MTEILGGGREREREREGERERERERERQKWGTDAIRSRPRREREREREKEREREREREGLHIFTSLDENRETATALLNELNPDRYCMEHVVFKLRISEREKQLHYNCVLPAQATSSCAQIKSI